MTTDKFAALAKVDRVFASAPGGESGWREDTIGCWVNGDQRIYETALGDFIRADCFAGSYQTLDAAKAASEPAPPAESAGEVEREDDPDEPIPGLDCSPFGMSPKLANYRLRKLSAALSDVDRNEVAGMIDRLVAEIDAAEAKCREMEGEVERRDDVLRQIASSLSVGGYNAETVDPDVFHRKISDGIDTLTRPLEQDASRYRTLRNIGAAPAGTVSLDRGLVFVSTNLDAWIDAKQKNGLGIAPSHAAEGKLSPTSLAIAEANLTRLTTAAQAARGALEVASANLEGVCMDTSRSPILETRLGDRQLIQAADARIDEALACLDAVLPASTTEPGPPSQEPDQETRHAG